MSDKYVTISRRSLRGIFCIAISGWLTIIMNSFKYEWGFWKYFFIFAPLFAVTLIIVEFCFYFNNRNKFNPHLRR